MPEMRMAEKDICDFCSDPAPVVAFEAEDNFLMDEAPGLPEFRSRGNWLACQPCAAMIESERWSDLAERAFANMRAKYRMALPEAMIRATVERSHKLFKKHRKKQDSVEGPTRTGGGVSGKP